MALARVQSTAPVTVAAAATTLTITFTTPPTLGNAIIVPMIGHSSSRIPNQCTDNYGNHYLRTADYAAAAWSAQFVCPKIAVTGGSFAITISFNLNDDCQALAIEVSGVGDGLAVDQIARASGSSTTPASGATAALTAAEVFVVGAHAGQATQASITVASVTPPWVSELEALPNTFASGEVDSRVLTGAAGTTTSISWTTSASQTWTALLVAYRATVAATGLARVQATAQVNSGGVNSFAVSFTTPPTVGNGVVLPLAIYTSSSNPSVPHTVVDNQGHTFALAVAAVGTGDTHPTAAIFYLPKLTAVAGAYSVTVTAPSSLLPFTVGVGIEISGVGAGLTVAALTRGGSSGTGTAASTGNSLASPVAELFDVAVLSLSGTITALTVEAVSPTWTQEAEKITSGSALGELDSRLRTSQTGVTQSCSWTWATTRQWAAALAAFTATALVPTLVTVPDVVGETEAAADTLLVAAGLVTGTVTTASSDSVAAGLVISQSPTAGASAVVGSAVDLVVSTGPPGPPVYVIGIGETDVVPLLATFRIQETIDAPDTMIADVFTVGTPFVRFTLGDPVVVTENGVRIFGGVVTGLREQGLTGPSATDLVVEIQATSYEISAARRVITAAISQDGAETIGAAFATLVTDYYAEVGVTLHPSQVPGPALPAATFTRSRGDAVNKQLASSVGYLQSIDFENRLRAWAPGDVAAPDDYDEATNPELLTGDVTVERQLQNGYANRVILVGDPIPVPDHKDSFTGDGVSPTWPITYQVTGPFPYFVDGAVAFGVVEYPATSTTESIGGVESPPGYLWEYDPIALTIHRRAGPVAAGVAFDFRYHGVFIPAGMAEDAGEIAALGLWEHVENVTAVITDISAQGYADALLAAKLASKDEIVRLQTRALGFHPGQTMTIASFSRALSGDYLISQVDTGSESGGIELVRSITASKSQNNTHDWRRVYQQWSGATDSGGGTLGIAFGVGDLADLVARSGLARSDATRSGYLG